MKKIIIIFILCISTKSFSQLVSNARNANISTIKTDEKIEESTQKNITVLSPMGRLAKPIIINKMDTTKDNKMISEKIQPQLLSTKRKQE